MASNSHRKRGGGTFHLDDESNEEGDHDVQFVTPYYDDANMPEPPDLSKLFLDCEDDSEDGDQESFERDRTSETGGRSRSRSVHENDLGAPGYLPTSESLGEGNSSGDNQGVSQNQNGNRKPSTPNANSSSEDKSGRKGGPLQHREVQALKKGLDEANQFINIPFFETSAKDSDNVEIALLTLVEHIADGGSSGVGTNSPGTAAASGAQSGGAGAGSGLGQSGASSSGSQDRKSIVEKAEKSRFLGVFKYKSSSASGKSAPPIPPASGASGVAASETFLNGTITLKVCDQSGEEMFFKVKKGTVMKKIMQAFADRKGVSLDVLRFTIDGTRVNAEDTPKMLEMEDGDQIDVLLQQLGGSDPGESTYWSDPDEEQHPTQRPLSDPVTAQESSSRSAEDEKEGEEQEEQRGDEDDSGTEGKEDEDAYSTEVVLPRKATSPAYWADSSAKPFADCLNGRINSSFPRPDRKPHLLCVIGGELFVKCGICAAVTPMNVKPGGPVSVRCKPLPVRLDHHNQYSEAAFFDHQRDVHGLLPQHGTDVFACALLSCPLSLPPERFPRLYEDACVLSSIGDDKRVVSVVEHSDGSLHFQCLQCMQEWPAVWRATVLSYLQHTCPKDHHPPPGTNALLDDYNRVMGTTILATSHADNLKLDASPDELVVVKCGLCRAFGHSNENYVVCRSLEGQRKTVEQKTAEQHNRAYHFYDQSLHLAIVARRRWELSKERFLHGQTKAHQLSHYADHDHFEEGDNVMSRPKRAHTTIGVFGVTEITCGCCTKDTCITVKLKVGQDGHTTLDTSNFTRHVERQHKNEERNKAEAIEASQVRNMTSTEVTEKPGYFLRPRGKQGQVVQKAKGKKVVMGDSFTVHIAKDGTSVSLADFYSNAQQEQFDKESGADAAIAKEMGDTAEGFYVSERLHQIVTYRDVSSELVALWKPRFPDVLVGEALHACPDLSRYLSPPLEESLHRFDESDTSNVSRCLYCAVETCSSLDLGLYQDRVEKTQMTIELFIRGCAVDAVAPPVKRFIAEQAVEDENGENRTVVWSLFLYGEEVVFSIGNAALMCIRISTFGSNKDSIHIALSIDASASEVKWENDLLAQDHVKIILTVQGDTTQQLVSAVPIQESYASHSSLVVAASDLFATEVRVWKDVRGPGQLRELKQQCLLDILNTTDLPENVEEGLPPRRDSPFSGIEEEPKQELAVKAESTAGAATALASPKMEAGPPQMTELAMHLPHAHLAAQPLQLGQYWFQRDADVLHCFAVNCPMVENLAPRTPLSSVPLDICSAALSAITIAASTVTLGEAETYRVALLTERGVSVYCTGLGENAVALWIANIEVDTAEVLFWAFTSPERIYFFTSSAGFTIDITHNTAGAETVFQSLKAVQRADQRNDDSLLRPVLDLSVCGDSWIAVLSADSVSVESTEDVQPIEAGRVLTLYHLHSGRSLSFAAVGGCFRAATEQLLVVWDDVTCSGELAVQRVTIIDLAQIIRYWEFEGVHAAASSIAEPCPRLDPHPGPDVAASAEPICLHAPPASLSVQCSAQLPQIESQQDAQGQGIVAWAALDTLTNPSVPTLRVVARTDPGFVVEVSLAAYTAAVAVLDSAAASAPTICTTAPLPEGLTTREPANSMVFSWWLEGNIYLLGVDGYLHLLKYNAAAQTIECAGCTFIMAA